MQTRSISRNFKRLVLLTVIAMLLAACASKPTIESDYDQTIDFSDDKEFS